MRNVFLKKCSDITYKYGKKARDYFELNSKCERCSEDRIVLLAIHHTHGKQVDKFETLCHNCHMLEHSNNKEYTYEDYKKSIKDADKSQEILHLLEKNVPIRKIISELNTSKPTIDKVMKKYGFISIPRKGYTKSGIA